MIDIREIDGAIAAIERKEIDWQQLERLAALYTVKNKMTGAEPERISESYSYASAPVLDVYGDSDFLRACADKDPAEVLKIIDRHMEAILAMYPREYDAVVRKIESLR